jgi:long-chain acyl-CoA synthetase
MTHPGEQFYPEGVHWDDPIARGTLPDLLSNAAMQYGARPAIEFRDRPISYAELEAMVELAAAAFLVTARTIQWRCSSATPPIIRSTSSAR